MTIVSKKSATQCKNISPDIVQQVINWYQLQNDANIMWKIQRNCSIFYMTHYRSLSDFSFCVFVMLAFISYFMNSLLGYEYIMFVLQYTHLELCFTFYCYLLLYFIVDIL